MAAFAGGAHSKSHSVFAAQRLHRLLPPRVAIPSLGLLLMLTCACQILRVPAQSAPRLRSEAQRAVLSMPGMERSYLLYVPDRKRAKAPLVVLLHGSRQTAQELRLSTGYAFDRLADEHGFVAVYPEGHGRRWNDCRARGRYAARKLNLDDVGFLLSLIDHLAKKADIDRTRVFLAGYSNGGQLAYRVALERPEQVTAIAAIAANLPSEENSLCHEAGRAVSTLLIHGTGDPISPFEGGKVSVFGFASRGTVRSTLASAEYFAQLAGLADRAGEADQADEQTLEATGTPARVRWFAAGTPEVMLIAVPGGGHVIPGPYAAFPRILGKVDLLLDGPRETWDFFSRQPSRPPR